MKAIVMSHSIIEIITVFLVDPATPQQTRIGEVEYSADGRLAVIDADPAFNAGLRAAVAALNSKAQIVELVPPDGPDTPRDAVSGRVTRRGDERFFEAMTSYLERYYGFTLG
jgi:hypothetical protein